MLLTRTQRFITHAENHLYDTYCTFNNSTHEPILTTQYDHTLPHSTFVPIPMSTNEILSKIVAEMQDRSQESREYTPIIYSDNTISLSFTPIPRNIAELLSKIDDESKARLRKSHNLSQRLRSFIKCKAAQRKRSRKTNENSTKYKRTPMSKLYRNIEKQDTHHPSPIIDSNTESHLYSAIRIETYRLITRNKARISMFHKQQQHHSRQSKNNILDSQLNVSEPTRIDSSTHLRGGGDGNTDKKRKLSKSNDTHLIHKRSPHSNQQIVEHQMSPMVTYEYKSRFHTTHNRMNNIWNLRQPVILVHTTNK